MICLKKCWKRQIIELFKHSDPFGVLFLYPKGANAVYKRIKISFINAGSITIDEGDWDDYDLCDGFIVIKKGDAWIAMYNAKEVFSVVLEK